MRDFAGIRTDADVILAETSILNFRRLLEQHQLTAQLFTAINAHLTARGVLVGRGTIMDATIINAPPSTKSWFDSTPAPAPYLRFPSSALPGCCEASPSGAIHFRCRL